jgi:AcrR family transcriptional regulator
MQKNDVIPNKTRFRLIEAASRVFARDGLTGATTRAIAREADVNEVTLFRHFGSKERLLAAVVKQNFEDEGRFPAVVSPRKSSRSLAADLVSYATEYADRLKDNLPLVRAMIGEIHRHGSNERQVYRGLFQPLREAIVERLSEAKAAHQLKPSADPVMLADLLTGMIFTDVLRRASPTFERHYSASACLEAAVQLVVKGASR